MGHKNRPLHRLVVRFVPKELRGNRQPIWRQMNIVIEKCQDRTLGLSNRAILRPAFAVVRFSNTADTP